MQYFPTSEGYVNFVIDPVIEDKGKYSYVYNYTDHLGNIRLSYAKNPVGNVITIVEESHYYPFGLKHRGYNTGKQIFEIEIAELKLKPAPPYFRNGNNYKYNGKELQEELGLNVYDYGARFYDPAAPRFWQIDPLAETSRRFSPYSYALDNPVFFIDRDGMFADTLEGQEDCCPGFPLGGNPPKETSPLGGTMQNFTPSDKTMSLLNEGKELLSNIFGYEAGVSAGYSTGVTATVGPVKLEAELTLAEVEVKSTNKSLVEAEIKGAGAKATASLGDKKAEAKASTGSTSVVVDKKLNVNTSSDGAKSKATISQGNANLSLKNSGTLGLSIKVPTPEGVSAKVGVTVNLYNAGKGIVKMIEGGVSYLSDYVSNYFSGN